ncbi:MAG: hypothetical protein KBS57_02970 [Alistipes sp.]|nr:hypothetical protein [Candidatus Minthomonas equi]
MSTNMKNQNNDEVTMESKLRSLYMIQKIDSKIDEIHLLRGELPEEVRDLEDEIAGLNTRISRLQTEIKEQESLISIKKIDIKNCEDNITRYDEQRNNVANNLEYESISKEIEFQGLEKELAQKKLREATDQLAVKKEALDVAIETLKGREEDLENKKKELVSIIEDTAREEEVLKAKLAEYEKGVDERMLAAYHKVRSNAHNHLAVVTVKRDACGGCFNKIPPQRQLDIAMNKKIIVCEYCGRILVSSDFEKEE